MDGIFKFFFNSYFPNILINFFFFPKKTKKKKKKKKELISPPIKFSLQ